MNLSRYTSNEAGEWDNFVAHAKNATFLLKRPYMDYHAERFTDHSLVFRNDKNNIIALLPANETVSTNGSRCLYSHQGLTYGGLILDKKATTKEVCEMFSMLADYLAANNFNQFVYKPTPWIYHTQPAEEDLYAVTNILHAQLSAREISSTINLQDRINFAQPRRTAINHARKAGIEVRESADIEAFWHILNDNLSAKYHKHPVHSIAELQLLRQRFSSEIRLFMALADGGALGGVFVYDCGQTIHTQYISANAEGKRLGAIDAIISHLINNVYASRRYLDFGKSTEQEGHYLNENLIFQKEGFGGRGVVYDTYLWQK